MCVRKILHYPNFDKIRNLLNGMEKIFAWWKESGVENVAWTMVFWVDYRPFMSQWKDKALNYWLDLPAGQSTWLFLFHFPLIFFPVILRASTGNVRLHQMNDKLSSTFVYCNYIFFQMSSWLGTKMIIERGKSKWFRLLSMDEGRANGLGFQAWTRDEQMV